MLSILMPFKNAASFLADTWHSIVNQDYHNWELIAVDDHSDDGSLLLFQEIAKGDSRLSVLRNEGFGILPALQTGLQMAQGEFITRMDADDLMPPKRLTRMVAALQESPPKSVITGLVEYFAQAQVSRGYKNYQSWLNRTNISGNQWLMLYRECVVASPNWMMRKAELLEAGGFLGLQYPEDYDLVFRWYENEFRIFCLNETTLWWREHPDRTSRNSENYHQKAFFKLKVKRFLQLEYRGDALVLMGTGQKGKITARILEKHKVDFHWMALFPEDHPNGIRQHRIEGINRLKSLANPKVLIAVYPPDAQRKKLVQFLKSAGLEEGQSYWFL